jgi:hypothetical protein
MRTSSKPALLFLPLIVLFIFRPVQMNIALKESITPTPTYDPLDEPPHPDYPTEYELGRNLYWHWCMTCHGDRGQGLTDEFRGIWEPEHQNCWGRGCHAGRSGDTGFPIPTIVPALVDDTHLAQFASVQELSDFLKATHPPQSPGILKNEEYRIISLFVFTLNNRPLIEIPSTATPAFISTGASNLSQEPKWGGNFVTVNIIVICSILAVLIFISIIKRGRIRKKDKLG